MMISTPAYGPELNVKAAAANAAAGGRKSHGERRRSGVRTVYVRIQAVTAITTAMADAPASPGYASGALKSLIARPTGIPRTLLTITTSSLFIGRR